MSLDLTFLGTGGAFTDFRANYHNNAAVHVGDGKVVLIDCGPTAVQSLKEFGIRAWDVPAVMVTHLHGDHVGGIEQLAWERFYTGRDGLPGWRKTRLVACTDVHPGLRSCLTPCVDEFVPQDAVARKGGYDDLFDVYAFQPDIDTVDFGKSAGTQGRVSEGVSFRFRRSPHVVGPEVDKPCYGLLLREVGRVRGGFYYTSDTTFRLDVGDLVPTVEADVIFHDCTFSPRYPGTVHTHYEELLTLPAEVRARTVLMHHTKVPDGVEVRKDGFLWAARKHDSFSLGDNKLTVSGPNGGAVFSLDGGVIRRVSGIRVG